MICIPGENLIPVDELSSEQISVIEPYCVAWHAVKRSHAYPDAWVAVQGCGPIGFAIAQLLGIIGTKTIVIEQPGNRLSRAEKSLDAKHVISASDDPIQAIREITDGDMVQFLFDATGNKAAIERGVDFLGPGGSYVVVGIWNGQITFHQPDIHRKELSLLSSRNATKTEFHEVIDFMIQEKVDTSSYISGMIPAVDTPGMFQTLAFESHDHLKVIVQWSH